MIEATNKALVRRWFDEVWNNRQAATVDKLMAVNRERPGGFRRAGAR